MRLEWSHLIRYRQWHEFEELAKRRPSQQLCDTLYELIQGIEEPAERKVLKKALYLVKTAGFTPMVEWPEEDARPRLKPVGTYGYLHSATTGGYYGVSFGIVRGSQLHYVLTHCSRRYQCIHINVGVSGSQALGTARDYMMKAPSPLTAEIEPAYALYRIREVWDNRRPDRTFGKFNSFWKQLFTHVPAQFPHPALDFEHSEDIGPEGRRALMAHPACALWRLWLPPDEPFWEQIHALRWNEELTPEVRAQEVFDLLMSDRTRLCSAEEISDFINRFMDCALILGQENPLAGEMMHAAAHLMKHKSRSEIFEEIVRHTSELIEKDIEEDEIEQSVFPRAMNAFTENN